MTLDRDSFIARFGGVFEHSSWVAGRAFDRSPSLALTVEAVHGALVAAFRAASPAERMAVLRAHPDLAGKLALARKLTQESTSEQASAGLDRLTPSEHRRFTDLNASYTEKFGFPFIVAVKGRSKDDILSAFENRIANSPNQEFETASAQVEKIARLRLQAMLAGDAND